MNFILIENPGNGVGCALVAADRNMAEYHRLHHYEGVRLIPNKNEALLAYKNALEKCLKQVKKEMQKCPK